MSRDQKTTSDKWKFNSNKKLGLERTLRESKKPLLKKSDPKILKKLNINLKMPPVNKKTLARNGKLLKKLALE